MFIKITQVKTALRYYPHPPPPIRLAEIQSLMTHSVGKTIRKWIFSYNAGGGINLYKLYENLFVKNWKNCKISNAYTTLRI